ncbi:shikimate dehydrogenase [Streptococcus panodentis]|uniref:Shikimate dehydrogenase (NADP(+)) n=1 Tax=Streptococcus panodentis TaxID=1581472 RepID=A0ABS5AZC9_9STRE|nr:MULTISPECIES: shikimate dehydrogenase [Streptococcus]KXT83950.1 Shikimate/quinate 5-dehydrogenase I beta [Streptococcus sp. DD11]MBP2621771.1 shikimate dehydrogenase [Streptococcus panodentis]
MKINGHTRMAAVVANPIKHSISPFVHNYAFEKTGVNGVYVAWEVTRKDLKMTIENIRRFNMFGVNLSMPYKQAVIPYLDEIDPVARLIGSVNTVVHRNGRLIGYNTDGKGFFQSLPSFAIKGKKMTILGAGGAAMAIIGQGALDGVAAVDVFTRTASLEKAQKRIEAIEQETGVPIRIFSLEDQLLLQERIQDAELFVNATGVGMNGRALPITSEFIFPQEIIVADMIYQPFESPFLKLAASQGIQTVNGLGMLLYQGAEAFKLWTGKTMPSQEIWQKLEEMYK